MAISSSFEYQAALNIRPRSIDSSAYLANLTLVYLEFGGAHLTRATISANRQIPTMGHVWVSYSTNKYILPFFLCFSLFRLSNFSARIGGRDLRSRKMNIKEAASHFHSAPAPHFL
jgi:hypothetical protein